MDIATSPDFDRNYNIDRQAARDMLYRALQPTAQSYQLLTNPLYRGQPKGLSPEQFSRLGPTLRDADPRRKLETAMPAYMTSLPDPIRYQPQ